MVNTSSIYIDVIPFDVRVKKLIVKDHLLLLDEGRISVIKVYQVCGIHSNNQKMDEHRPRKDTIYLILLHRTHHHMSFKRHLCLHLLTLGCIFKKLRLRYTRS